MRGIAGFLSAFSEPPRGALTGLLQTEPEEMAGLPLGEVNPTNRTWRGLLGVGAVRRFAPADGPHRVCCGSVQHVRSAWVVVEFWLRVGPFLFRRRATMRH